jgi:hypothetical protein
MDDRWPRPPETPQSHDLFLFLASTAHDMKNSISVLSGTLERLLVESLFAADANRPIRKWRTCCTRPSA